MGASRPQTPRCFLVLDYLFSSTRKLQFYVEFALATYHKRQDELYNFMQSPTFFCFIKIIIQSSTRNHYDIVTEGIISTIPLNFSSAKVL